MFHSLNEEQLMKIVDIQLERVLARLAERHIRLKLTDGARKHLIHTGSDPSYGARPLKRAIQKKIETPIGRLLLQGTIRDGQTVVVDESPSGTVSHSRRKRSRKNRSQRRSRSAEEETYPKWNWRTCPRVVSSLRRSDMAELVWLARSIELGRGRWKAGRKVAADTLRLWMGRGGLLPEGDHAAFLRRAGLAVRNISARRSRLLAST